MYNMKAAALIGLSIVMSGVCDASAATLPVTETFSITAPAFSGSPVTDTLSFAQFNPSMGTLTGIDFNLSSTISGEFTSGDQASIFINGTPFATDSTSLLFNFVDRSGLMGGLTTADYTGTGNITVILGLDTSGDPSGSPPGTGNPAIWSGNGVGGNEGLTLVYDYTPAPPATPLPAALPLFATGLGVLGLLGWLRKRKAQAAAV